MLVKDLRTKSPAELTQLISDLKAELFMLRFKNSTGQLDQPHKISLVKKDIAKVFTVINEQEEQGKVKIKKAAIVKKVTVNKTEKKEGTK